MSGKLYLVATPIGNLGDLSPRAADTLRQCDFIAAEDTRVTLKLLNHFEIKRPLVSYYEHNRASSGEKILARILEGETCALVTDAGMPAVSDPGEDLVRICAAAGVEILVVPGACAAVSALALSGLPTGRFTFEGFLSTAKKSRSDHLDELREERRTMIFLEAPHKLRATLSDMAEAFGPDRRVSISRELTKIHEETLRLTLGEAVSHFETTPPKGEFVIVVEGAPESSPAAGAGLPEALAAVSRYRDGGLSVKDAAKRASEESGISKKTIYDAALKAARDTE
ncbi:MAG: 16S rRNA (cytidine(1402)-2'-O)-methyltransferase [Oscillospiraceae bacterium]|nr:16S rRNA (cytidine(1402)-2'-O)-methyltransferase [Oscillospiraceae bacterium]